MTIAELQAKFDELKAQVASNIDVEASAALLLTTLGDLLRANANDPVAIQAIADGMTDRAGALNASATELAGKITENTPT